jgi:hypothetical protein
LKVWQKFISHFTAAGAKYNLTNRYAVCVEATYKRGLVSNSPDPDNKEYLYCFGLNVIFLFAFK